MQLVRVFVLQRRAGDVLGLHDVHDEIPRAGEGIEDVDALRIERGAEVLAEDVRDAGDHELHERLRGIDDAEHVGLLHREAPGRQSRPKTDASADRQCDAFAGGVNMSLARKHHTRQLSADG